MYKITLSPLTGGRTAKFLSYKFSSHAAAEHSLRVAGYMKRTDGSYFNPNNGKRATIEKRTTK